VEERFTGRNSENKLHWGQNKPDSDDPLG